MAINPCIVGFDFGTTSLSATVISIDTKKVEKVLCYTTHAYLQFEDIGRKEQSLSVLSNLFFRMLDEIKTIKGIQILSFGFTGQMHGVIGLDKNYEAVTNLVTWQDKSGSMILPSGESLLEQIQTCSGKALADGYGVITLYKWLRYENRKDIVNFCTVADYFAGLLSGSKPYKMDATNAHSIGLFDIYSLEWDKDAISRLELQNISFPDIITGAQIVGYADWGIDKIPVAYAIGDNQSSFMGSMLNPAESILLNVGTGTQLSFLIKKEDLANYEKYVDGFETQLRPYDSMSYLLATSFINGGSVYKALFNFFKETGSMLLGVNDIEDGQLWKYMEKAGLEVLDDKNQLQVSPLLDGLRKDRSKNGSVAELTVTNFHPGYFITGFLKGLAVYYKSCYFPELKKRTKFICGSGNGLKRNALFRRIIEDTFERPLYTVAYNEEASVGAALNGAIATQLISKEDCGTFISALSKL